MPLHCIKLYLNFYYVITKMIIQRIPSNQGPMKTDSAVRQGFPIRKRCQPPAALMACKFRPPSVPHLVGHLASEGFAPLYSKGKRHISL